MHIKLKTVALHHYYNSAKTIFPLSIFKRSKKMDSKPFHDAIIKSLYYNPNKIVPLSEMSFFRMTSDGGLFEIRDRTLSRSNFRLPAARISIVADRKVSWSFSYMAESNEVYDDECDEYDDYE